MAKHLMPAGSLDDRAIAERAYQIYIAQGMPGGRAEEHWHEARRQLLDLHEPPRDIARRPRRPR